MQNLLGDTKYLIRPVNKSFFEIFNKSSTGLVCLEKLFLFTNTLIKYTETCQLSFNSDQLTSWFIMGVMVKNKPL